MARKTAAQQIEAQDKREAKTREHEDKHRFTANMRVVFAEFLDALSSGTHQAQQLLDALRAEIGAAEMQHAGAAIVDLHRSIVRDRGYASRFDEFVNPMGHLLWQIELVASNNVRSIASSAHRDLAEAFASIISEWTPDNAAEHIQRSRAAQFELIDVMCIDLGDGS